MAETASLLKLASSNQEPTLDIWHLILCSDRLYIIGFSIISLFKHWTNSSADSLINELGGGSMREWKLIEPIMSSENLFNEDVIQVWVWLQIFKVPAQRYARSVHWWYRCTCSVLSYRTSSCKNKYRRCGKKIAIFLHWKCDGTLLWSTITLHHLYQYWD